MSKPDLVGKILRGAAAVPFRMNGLNALSSSYISEHGASPLADTIVILKGSKPQSDTSWETLGLLGLEGHETIAHAGKAVSCCYGHMP